MRVATRSNIEAGSSLARESDCLAKRPGRSRGFAFENGL